MTTDPPPTAPNGPREFAFRSRKRVVIDPKAGTIRFERCHVPRRFLARAEREATMPLSAIRGVYERTGRDGRTLMIATDRGRAVILGRGGDYPGLRDALGGDGRVEQGGPAFLHPLMGLGMVVAMLLGMYATFLVGRAAAGALGLEGVTLRSDGSLGLAMLVGAGAGASALWLAVDTADRLWGVNLGVPIGAASAGLFLAAIFGLMTLTAAGVPIERAAWVIPAGGLMGLAYGILALRAWGRQARADRAGLSEGPSGGTARGGGGGSGPGRSG